MTIQARVYEWLRRSGRSGCGDVAQGLSLSLSTASDTLRRLNDFGLLTRQGAGRSVTWGIVPGTRAPGDRRGGQNKGQEAKPREVPRERVVEAGPPTLPPHEWEDGRLEHHWGVGVCLTFAPLAVSVHTESCSEAPGLRTPVETVSAFAETSDV